MSCVEWWMDGYIATYKTTRMAPISNEMEKRERESKGKRKHARAPGVDAWPADHPNIGVVIDAVLGHGQSAKDAVGYTADPCIITAAFLFAQARVVGALPLGVDALVAASSDKARLVTVAERERVVAFGRLHTSAGRADAGGVVRTKCVVLLESLLATHHTRGVAVVLRQWEVRGTD